MSAAQRLSSAMLFLAIASVRNGVRMRLRRLRQPRYLLPTALGAFYLGSMFLRWVTDGPWVDPTRLPQATVWILAMTISGVVAAWLFGGEEGAIQFSEAEVQFLFPGPLDRRLLLHYKLIRIIIVVAWSAFITTLLFGLRLTTHTFVFWLGAWIGLSTLGLHLVAASLTRAMLVESGISGRRRRVLTAVVLAMAVLGLFAAAATVAPFPTGRLALASTLTWAATAISTPPLSIVLFPAKASVDVALSQDVVSMLWALPAALLSLGAHYAWAAWSATSFEDASVAAAERRGKTLDALRSGQARWIRRTRPPFTLAGTGRPEVALLWRSLIAANRVFSVRFAILLGIFLVAMIAMMLAAFGDDAADGGQLAVVGATTGVMAVFVALLGPQSLSLDLRLDRDRMDVLRSWPVSGARIVAGAIAGPALVLSVVIGLLVAAATGFVLWSGLLTPGWSLALGTVGVLVGPSLAVAGLVVNNAWAVVFPQWSAHDARASGGGFEAFGQRLMLLFASWLVVGVALIPSAILGVPLAIVAGGPVGAAVAGVVATWVLAIESLGGIILVGRVFDRFEPIAA